MGQYYRPLIIRNSRARYYNTFCIPDEKAAENLDEYDKAEYERRGCFYMLAKLMEHSWVGNPLVEGICEKLLHKSATLAWVGDYATLPTEYAGKNPWNKEGCGVKYHTHKKENFLDGCYLVNHSKKEFLDFTNYYERSATKEKWQGKEYTNCIHPLPLLTACGNGLGGGDYHGSDIQFVGRWAFDKIEILTTRVSIPEGYTEIRPTFKEYRATFIE